MEHLRVRIFALVVVRRDAPNTQLLFAYMPREDRIVQYDAAGGPIVESQSALDASDMSSSAPLQDYRPHVATLHVCTESFWTPATLFTATQGSNTQLYLRHTWRTPAFLYTATEGSNSQLYIHHT